MIECTCCHFELDDEAVFCPRCSCAVEGAEEQTAYEYEAFISYRHLPRDTAVAKEIQRRLEGMRVPRELRARAGRNRLGRMFRDEDELPTAASLSEQIRDALKRSRFLIVVCSPETRESLWVMREVELFASFHGRDRILVALAAAEPDESLPPLLLEKMVQVPDYGMMRVKAEPLASDFRSKDKYQAESLRMAAAMLGCGYDDLRQRLRARRNALAAKIAAAVAAVAVCFAGFALYQQAQITENYLKMQTSQSRLLAEKSNQLYAQGDRMLAVHAALAALPDSSTSNDRPFVAEAQNALEKSLQVYDAAEEWRPCYSHEEDARVVRVAVDAQHDRYATLDENSAIHVYELTTGKPISAMTGRDNSIFSYTQDLSMKGDLLVYCDETGRKVTAFDVASGEQRWVYQCDESWTDVTFSGIDISDSTERIAIAALCETRNAKGDSDKTNMLIVLDGRTGAEHGRFDAGYTQKPATELMPAAADKHVRFDARERRVAATFGSTLFIVDLSTGNASSAKNPVGSVPVFAWANDNVVAMIERYDIEQLEGATVTSMTGRSICSYSAKAAEQWSVDVLPDQTNLDGKGIWSVDADGDGSNATALASVGTHLFTVNLKDGTLRDVGTFDAAVRNCLLEQEPGGYCRAITAQDDIVGMYWGRDRAVSNREASLFKIGEAHFAHVEDASGKTRSFLVAVPSAADRSGDVTVWSLQSPLDEFGTTTPNLSRCWRNVDGTLLAVAARHDDDVVANVLDAKTFETVARINAKDLQTSGRAESIDCLFSFANPDRLYLAVSESVALAPDDLYVVNARSGEIIAHRALADFGPNAILCGFCAGNDCPLVSLESGRYALLNPNTLENTGEIAVQKDSSPPTPIDFVSNRFEIDQASNAYERCSALWCDGDRLVAGHTLLTMPDGKLVECDLNTRLEYASGNVLVHSDDRGAFVVAADKQELMRFDLPSGKLTWTVQLDRALRMDGSVRITPDGAKIVILDSSAIEVRDARTGAVIGKSKPAITSDAVLAEDNGKRLTAIIGDDKLIVRRALDDNSNVGREMMVIDLNDPTLTPLSSIEHGVTVATDLSRVLIHGEGDRFWTLSGTNTWVVPYRTLDELIALGKETVADFPLTDRQRETIAVD